MESVARNLGIIGAGRLGRAVGKAAHEGGWNVVFNDVADPITIAMTLNTLIPGAKMVTCTGLARMSDVIVLALPLSESEQINYQLLDDKVVLDAMNDWGNDASPAATSEVVAARNPRMHLAKSINHLSYHDYSCDPREKGDPKRRAMAIATDYPDAAAIISELVDDMGFDPIVAPFSKNRLLEPGGPIFGVTMNAIQMSAALN